jgi:hypothetical protein
MLFADIPGSSKRRKITVIIVYPKFSGPICPESACKQVPVFIIKYCPCKIRLQYGYGIYKGRY